MAKPKSFEHEIGNSNQFGRLGLAAAAAGFQTERSQRTKRLEGKDHISQIARPAVTRLRIPIETMAVLPELRNALLFSFVGEQPLR
jgi:hypothetical protein